MHHILHIVTGAPGAGKSTAVAAFLDLGSASIAFDSDWLIAAASDLAGKDIHVAQSTWKAYGAVWFEVLHAIHANGKTAVFFTPTSPRDVEEYGQPAWCTGIRWLLLDCDDATRARRLTQRPGWTTAMREDAITDARELRQTVSHTIDTGLVPPQAAAQMIAAWLHSTSEHRDGSRPS